MKSYLILLFFFGFLVCTSTKSIAQENAYFENNPVWQVNSGCAIPYPCVQYETYNYFIGDDIELNGLIYKKIFKTGSGDYQYYDNDPVPPFCTGSYEYQNQLFELAIRSSGKQMYVCACEGCEEELLYDFDLEVGETLPLSYNNWSEDITVLAIDSVYTPFGYRKRFAISGNETSAEYLIEGIGHSRGFIEPINVILECGYNLECYSLNDSAYYPEPGEGCMLTVDIDDNQSPTAVTVFPNPFTESTTISFAGNIGIPSVSVYNLQGKQVPVEVNVLENQLTINRGRLKSGLYVYRIGFDSQEMLTGKLFVVD
jgi:hypothetical protein